MKAGSLHSGHQGGASKLAWRRRSCERKLGLFDDRMLATAIERLTRVPTPCPFDREHSMAEALEWARLGQRDDANGIINVRESDA